MCVCWQRRTQACKLMCGLSRWIKDMPWRVCNSADVCLAENTWWAGSFIGKTLYSSSYRAPYWGLTAVTAWYCLWVFEYVVMGGENGGIYWKRILFFKNGQISLSFALSLSLSGGRVGSVQSDASSSPTEHGHMGQSHPTYPLGPQVRTHTFSPHTITLTSMWNGIYHPFYI